ncbi:MAG TPA: ATP-dependent helicase, partial [Candidatus Merdenecus merdavium]|nr:ATP-dependent helicase [Candidatus Merdenecus merdavium]
MTKLNDSQQQAILHKDGPMLVLAGPGSGKTMVITKRAKYLIEHYGISPTEILVITFTKAAAKEMQERFVKLMGGERTPVTFGTFHAIYFGILKQAYGFNASNIIREDQRNAILKEIIDSLELEIDDESEFLTGIKSEISAVKNDRIALENYYSTNCSEEIFRSIYGSYHDRLHKQGLLDFDDMLVYCYDLLSQRSDILSGWQKRFRYILIDEFQDINQIQYDVIKMIAKPLNNLFIVGDDDQSIYRFRGAKPEIMLNFQKDYEDAKMVLLDINYRSTKKIVEAAGKVIGNNSRRYPKKITTLHETGENVEILTFADQREENQYIIDHIKAYVEEGNLYQDIAVLYRTNLGPRLLVEKFMEYNIPFHMKDTLPNLYEHWIAKNIITYIHLAMGSRERKDFLQIINRPKRYISRECLDPPEITFLHMRKFYYDKQWMIDRINKLEYDLKLLSQMTPYSAIHYIRNGIEYEEYLKEYATYRRIKPEELIDVLDEIQESSKSFKTYEDWFAHIDQYTLELQQQAKKQQVNNNSVTFATLHSSKGLEFKNVYLIDVNEGIIPHKKAIIDADIQEERRMFYVGMTRAKSKLHIFSVKELNNKKLDVSRFVGEMLISKEDLKVGMTLYHVKYKEGMIEAIDGKKMVINF